MSVEQITSRKNPLLVHIKKLAASRSYRRGCGEYLGDGTKLLEEALHGQASLSAVVVSQGPPVPEGTGDARLVEVPPEELLDADTPEILAALSQNSR